MLRMELLRTRILNGLMNMMTPDIPILNVPCVNAYKYNRKDIIR